VTDPIDLQGDAVLREVRRLADGLGGGRTLAGATGADGWPRRGVYLFLDPGEPAGDGGPRVVRVGTHGLHTGSRSTLWGRLRTHRGPRAGRSGGGGNHRASVFRLHVGAAMLAADPTLPRLPAWGVGGGAPREVREREAAHERRVSAYIGRLTTLWLDVPDDPGPACARGRLERGLIALLAAQARRHDPASPGWLGRCSPAPQIRASGLWNVRHVDDPLDPDLPALLAACVDRTLAAAPARPRALSC
jgi:hypothetical protein